MISLVVTSILFFICSGMCSREGPLERCFGNSEMITVIIIAMLMKIKIMITMLMNILMINKRKLLQALKLFSLLSDLMLENVSIYSFIRSHSF